jgi:predicted metal-dependent HD superfamily phosphohydrolase
MLKRWEELGVRLGLSTEAVRQEYPLLVKAYGASGRAYHGLEHIAACLELLDQAPLSAPERDLLELALWFHDVVYHPRAADNEARSNDWAQRFLSGADPHLRQEVAELIMVTQRHQPRSGTLETWMVDIDLGILGSPPALYDDYETAIRQEYRWVPWFLYRSKRKQVLEGFRQREHIYHEPYFRAGREQQARENLSRAIAKL